MYEAGGLEMFLVRTHQGLYAKNYNFAMPLYDTARGYGMGIAL